MTFYLKYGKWFLVLLLLCSLTASAAVKKKRFDMSAPSKGESTVEVQQPQEQPTADTVVRTESFSPLAWLIQSQKVLREKVSATVASMKQGEWSSIWKFLVICLVYGMLHALGPGHGKSVVIGFFLARRGRWRQGVALGAGITFVHTLSAVVLLFVLFAIFRAAVFPVFESGREGIEKASYLLLMFTGLALAVIGGRDLLRHGHDAEKPEAPPLARWREIIGVAAITGIVPCPAVALIVLFCLLHSMVFLALLGAAVICVGMTVTNVSFGIAAVAFRKGLDKKSAHSRFAAKIYGCASVAGGTLIFLSGLFLLSNMFAGRV